MHTKVVIVGGGFAGLSVARQLDSEEFDITIIDKTNHHVFQPLLYQVATAALSPGDIAVPIRAIFTKKKNVRVLLGEVVSVDTNNNKVELTFGMLSKSMLSVFSTSSISDQRVVSE